VKNLKILLVVVLLNSTELCHADRLGDLERENADLRTRVERLERQLQEFKTMVIRQSQSPQPVGPPAQSESRLQPIAAEVQHQTAARQTIRTDLHMTPYGHVKLDAAYDTSRIETGNFAKWVESEGQNKNDEQFNMTANQTRLGLKIEGPEDDVTDTSGLIEVDFFENGDATNKARVQMRHAYMKIFWPQERFDILAGQTWDVISPLNPNTLNYSVAWWAGNIGFRRPQMRVTKAFDLTDSIEGTLQGALTRNIGDGGADFTGCDAGEDAAIPGIQGRAGFEFPLRGQQPTTLGLSGHWAEEELDVDIHGNNHKYNSWSLNLDLTQPINKWLTVKGELFTGENLCAYLGGIGHGINTTTRKEVGSRGGWIAATITPAQKWDFNLGVSVDDVDGDDLAGVSGDQRQYNRSVFANFLYLVNSNTQIGFELSHWYTQHRGQSDGDSLRAQTSVIYRF
jgi:hypothetical protein